MKLFRSATLILLTVLLLPGVTGFVNAHIEAGEAWLVVLYFSGDLKLETSHFAAQWSSGRDVDIMSAWNHSISMVALNNGTHIYFHVRWPDSTVGSTEEDGLAGL